MICKSIILKVEKTNSTKYFKMAHKLFLGIYQLKIKERGTKGKDVVSNNSFLSNSYSGLGNKFLEGYVKDIVKQIEDKTYKNKDNTHGALLLDKKVNGSKRSFDVLLNGGLTGIKQFIVKPDGQEGEEISDSDTVGLRFFARVWLPAGSNTLFLFLQRYSDLTIKPIFEDIFQNLYKNKGFTIINNLQPTTTKKRLKTFLRESEIKDVSIIGKRSPSSTSGLSSYSMTLRLASVKTDADNRVDFVKLKKYLSQWGVSLSKKQDFDLKTTYQHPETKEVKTGSSAEALDTQNFVPNIPISASYRDHDGFPDFEKMRAFVDKEIEQIEKELKE